MIIDQISKMLKYNNFIWVFLQFKVKRIFFKSETCGMNVVYRFLKKCCKGFSNLKLLELKYLWKCLRCFSKNCSVATIDYFTIPDRTLDFVFSRFISISFTITLRQKSKEFTRMLRWITKHRESMRTPLASASGLFWTKKT